jgi:hypothetical protein
VRLLVRAAIADKIVDFDLDLFGRLLEQNPSSRGRPSAPATGNFPVFVSRENRNMAQLEYDFLYWIDTLQPHHWVMILAGVIIVGAICMKGAANRSHM